MGNKQQARTAGKSGYIQRLLIVMVTLVLLVIISAGMLILRNYVQRMNEKATTTSALASSSPVPKPIFEDTFANNKKGWYVGQSAGYARLITNNGLMLTDTNHTIMVESLPISQQFEDVTITTTFTFVSGGKQDSVGLYVRGDSNLDHDYRIEIFGDNTYAISKESIDARNGQEITFLVPPTTTPLLNPRGQANTLTLTMDVSTLTLSINGKVASQITDTEYTTGQVALFVSNDPTSNGVVGLFSSISITPIIDSKHSPQ